MTAATAQAVQYLNLAYFGRPADPASLTAWPATGYTIEQIVAQFANTAEYQTNTVNPNSVVNQSGGRTFNDTNLVNTFYQRLFGRLASAAEVSGWSNALASGAVNYEYLGVTILQAALNLPTNTEMRQVLIAKFDSAQLYTGILYNNSSAAASYSSSTAIQDGISFLNGVTTTTAATFADATAAVATMTAESGGGAGGTSFAAISNNAVLTSGANVNGNGTGPGFTPSASTLGASNDTIRLGVFNGATISDSSTSDTDVLILDAVGFNQSAAVVAGIETINLNGAAAFGAGQLAGVRNVNILQAASFSGGATITTAQYTIANTGLNSIGSGAGSLSQFRLSLNSAGNGATIALDSTTAINAVISSTANNSVTISQAALAGSIDLLAGSANTYTLNLAGAGTYTGGATFSAGGGFTLNAISQFNKLNTVSGASANFFSFQGTGTNVYSLNGEVGAATLSQNLSSVSGLDVLNVKTLTASSGFSAGLISAGFAFNLKNNAFTINLGGTAVVAGFTAYGSGTLSGGANAAAADLVFSANNATSAVETFTLGFNAGTGALNIASGGIIIGGGTANTAAIEVFNLNVYGASAGVTLINPVAAVSGYTTFNLNATAQVTFALSAANLGQVGSSFINIGFTQVDNNATFSIGSAWLRTAADFQGFVLSFGSGNDVLDTRNYISLTGAASLISQMAANTAIFNVIDISDGGADRITIGEGGVAGARSGFSRASIIGFGIGDTLQFTQAGGTYATVVTLTAASGATGLTAGIGLFYDGSDTLVFAMSAAGEANARAVGSAFAAKIVGADYSNFARWNLNAAGGTLSLNN